MKIEKMIKIVDAFAYTLTLPNNSVSAAKGLRCALCDDDIPIYNENNELCILKSDLEAFLSRY